MSEESKWPLYIQRRFALKNARYKDPSGVSCAAPNGDADLEVKEVVEWIYGVLTTLDAKASALMRLNGVLIADCSCGISARTLSATGRVDSLYNELRCGVDHFLRAFFRGFNLRLFICGGRQLAFPRESHQER